LGLGYSIERVRKLVPLGQRTIAELSSGRFKDGERLPVDLEPGERRVPRQRCEECGGAWIDVVPCRACRARLDILAKNRERKDAT